MIVFWVTLLVLHRGYSLAPVITAELGESVTFTCSNKDLGSKEVYWYKQNPGGPLKLIITLYQSNSVYGHEFSNSQLNSSFDKNYSNLTILRTTRDNEGMYHCEVKDWINTKWSSTYLMVEGNPRRMLNYVVQSSSFSGPVHPGDSVSFQCSVLSDSNKTCPGGPSVYWIRTGSDKSGLGIIYTDVNDECEQRSDSVKSCVYRFSKNISSSDAGTYHCAVASCGHILFGNGSNLQIKHSSGCESYVPMILSTFLAISVTGNIIFICYQTSRTVGQKLKGSENPSKRTCGSLNTAEGRDDLNYAALHFTVEREKSGKKTKGSRTEESVYSKIKR